SCRERSLEVHRPRDAIAPRDRQIFDSPDILRGSQQSDSDVRPACSLGKDGANLGCHGPTVLRRLRGEWLLHGVVETATAEGRRRRPPPLISIMISSCAAPLPEARTLRYDTAPVTS